MRNAGKCLRSALILSAYVIGACMTLDQPAIAQDFYGDWRGSGFARPGIFGKKEKIFCKIAGKASGKGKSELSGRCAATTKSGKFSLQITESSGGKVAAIASFAGLAGTFTYSGRKRSSGYVLRSDKPITQEKITFNSQIFISYNGATKMTLTETAVDVSNGNKTTVLSISFKRQ